MNELPQNSSRSGLQTSLQRLGLTEYESKAYLSLLNLGVCDARQLCAQSGVPSSKIYSIMEKFELLGLAEVQQSKPVKFKPHDPATGIDRLLKNKEKEVLSIKDTLPLLENQLDAMYSKQATNAVGNQPFFNMQFGMKDHIQKHLPLLASARKKTFSYFETTCLQGARIYGHLVKQDIMKNIIRHDVSSRVLFGTDNKKLVQAFLKGLPEIPNLEFKVTSQIHAPFHVIDENSAIVVVDNPLFKDGRIASIHIVEKGLAKVLSDGYRSLWDTSKSLE
jgi:sugar-specific transcriptional regulator TrmB